MTTYAEFLARRARRQPAAGVTISTELDGLPLAPFQDHIVRWACQVGRPAVWADTGLGKTRMQLAWCHVMADTSLIVTPLAVAQQTVEEAGTVGIPAQYVRHQSDVTGPGVWVTNLEMVDRFDPATFGAVALDEASILKQSDGRTRTRLIETFAEVPYRSTWTATPAPNDPEELTNQSEFLGHMTRTNMLAAYFVHDQDGWRMKGHAWEPLVQWITSWALAVRTPSDLGYPDNGYILPGLDVIPQIVDVNVTPGEGELFAATIGGVTGRARARRESMPARVQRAADLVAAEPDEPWLLWCGLNDEANELARIIPGAVNVHGSLTPDEKADILLGFAHGDIPVLITKPKIAGLGMNFQRCARMAFVGLNDSWEQYYQAIRRSYRFGQTRPVHAHVIVSRLEAEIATNVARKEKQANRIVDAMVRHVKESA